MPYVGRKKYSKRRSSFGRKRRFSRPRRNSKKMYKRGRRSGVGRITRIARRVVSRALKRNIEMKRTIIYGPLGRYQIGPAVYRTALNDRFCDVATYPLLPVYKSLARQDGAGTLVARDSNCTRDGVTINLHGIRIAFRIRARNYIIPPSMPGAGNYYSYFDNLPDLSHMRFTVWMCDMDTSEWDSATIDPFVLTNTVSGGACLLATNLSSIDVPNGDTEYESSAMPYQDGIRTTGSSIWAGTIGHAPFVGSSNIQERGEMPRATEIMRYEWATDLRQGLDTVGVNNINRPYTGLFASPDPVCKSRKGGKDWRILARRNITIRPRDNEITAQSVTTATPKIGMSKQSYDKMFTIKLKFKKPIPVTYNKELGNSSETNYNDVMPTKNCLFLTYQSDLPSFEDAVGTDWYRPFFSFDSVAYWSDA